jgi:AraC-like DNA-binding protein
MFVSALILRGIADCLRERGIDTAHLLDGTGIDTALLMDASARVPLDAAERYVLRAIELTQDPGLGLTVAAAQPVGAQSLVYHLVLTCRSLREAFTAFSRIASQIAEYAQWTLEEEGDCAHFIYRRPSWFDSTSRFGADFSLAFASRLAGHFLQAADDRPIALYFRHARPNYVARYSELFSCRPIFDASENKIVFPREFLDRERYLGNPVLKESIAATAARLLSTRTPDERISDRVRVVLRYAGDFESVTSESVARVMALSERSLRRKLRSEGVSLMEVVDSVRKEIACEEMRRPNASIEAMAARLGYGDRTAFHRAFKRWTGVSPQSYRMRDAG